MIAHLESVGHELQAERTALSTCPDTLGNDGAALVECRLEPLLCDLCAGRVAVAGGRKRCQALEVPEEAHKVFLLHRCAERVRLAVSSLMYIQPTWRHVFVKWGRRSKSSSVDEGEA